MICDTLENLAQYKGISRHLDTAIRFILTHELSALPLGKTVIDGDNVFVNVMEAEPRSSESADFELHRNYMDLQTDLAGSELFEVALGETTVTQPYDSASDFCAVRAAASCVGTLCEGRFALFLTLEPHKPTLRAQGCDKVKKAVFKIRDERAQ